MSRGWSRGKGKTQLALQGVAPCQGLDGECDKVCLLLPALAPRAQSWLVSHRLHWPTTVKGRVTAGWASTCFGKMIPWAGMTGVAQRCLVSQIQFKIKPDFWIPWLLTELLGMGVTWRPGGYGASKSGIGISHVVSGPGSCWQSRMLSLPLESCQLFTKFYPEAGK